MAANASQRSGMQASPVASGEEPPAKAGDAGKLRLVSGSGRTPEAGNGSRSSVPAWAGSAVLGVTKSQTTEHAHRSDIQERKQRQYKGWTYEFSNQTARV